MRKVLLCVLAMSLPLAAQQRTAMPSASSGKVDYEKDVKPLLEQNCYACHGDTVQQSGLRLDLRQNALRGGDYGPVILPGQSAESKLIKRLVDGDGGMQMPPTGPLSPEDIGVLRAWIDQGAEFRTTIVEAPPKPTDPRVAALVAAVRAQSADAVARLLASDSGAATARDAAGSTLLHHAAAFGSIDTMKLLLDAGADVNAANRRRSTPLHWSLHDEAKVRLLLSRGAAINAKQVEGRTPLYIAASMGQGASLVKLLLENGANAALATANGMSPLMAASVGGDVEAMKLLVDKNADVNTRNGAGETALMFAATNGSPAAVKFLIDHGADAKAKSKRGETALGNAGTAGVEETVRMLLDQHADVNSRNVRGYSPLMLAASSDTVPAGAVKLLLAAGADKTYVGDYDEAAIDFATKRGDTEVARLLGATAKPPVFSPISAHASFDAAAIPGAVEKAMGLLETQSGNFIRTAGCNSCHSQDLPSAAAGFAKSRGLRAPAEIPQLPQSMMPAPERLIDLAIVSAPSTAWELVDFGMNNVPPDAYTDAAVRLVRMMQRPDGSWSTNQSRRPPMSSGEFQDSAVCIFAVKHYGRAVDAAANDAVIARAVSWLETAMPQTLQDRAFQVIALAWAGRAESAQKAARTLVDLQRADGGWSQFAGVETDAYATGQAVYALSAARIPQDNATYRTGIAYLLRTQAQDGSWHVKTRSIWLQPYFESGFPYGRDQFISTAGTAWASMALATVNMPSDTTLQR
ncbi:MAG TPA: ankyrin repeat domain-containing protein [Vicinamibacterales bacterium]|nr:ankyrin repeat domain-containing protein [Vicinamibacterales bacterium]